jgi:hypothetical protein
VRGLRGRDGRLRRLGQHYTPPWSRSGSGGDDLGALDNAWILFDTTPIASTDEDVLFFRYDAPDQPADLGGGCAGGGLNVNPCAFESNPEFQLQLVGAAPNAPTFCVLSALTEPFPSGACIWTPKLLPGR